MNEMTQSKPVTLSLVFCLKLLHKNNIKFKFYSQQPMKAIDINWLVGCKAMILQHFIKIVLRQTNKLLLIYSILHSVSC